MKKEAFTLFEVLISLVLFAVMLSAIVKIYVNDDTATTYYKLQQIQNDYINNGTIKKDKDIEFKQN